MFTTVLGCAAFAVAFPVTMRAPSTSTDLELQNPQGFWFFDSEKFPGEKFGTRIPQGL